MAGSAQWCRQARSAMVYSRKNAPDLIRRAYAARESKKPPFRSRQANSCNRSARFLSAGARNWLYLERVGANPGRCATAGKPADRMQQGLVPSPDPDIVPHAVLFRRPGDGPFRLALIAHASTQNLLHCCRANTARWRHGWSRGHCGAGAPTSRPWRDRPTLSGGSGGCEAVDYPAPGAPPPRR